MFDVCGYKLDSEQREVVLDNSKYTLVASGAGSGKTLTIIGKILYLIKECGYSSDEILCISFTNACCDSLKKKLLDFYGLDLDIYTFHKLSLNILESADISYSIASSNYLEYTVEEYFSGIILENEDLIKVVLRYFGTSSSNIIDGYLNLFSDKRLISLKQSIITFIHHLKEMGLDTNYLYTLLSHEKIYFHHFFKKQTLFLIIVIHVYLFYEEELYSSKTIDFSDMINLANKNVNRADFFKKYRYIIIDEYQDTSDMKLKLIKNILNVSGANLLVVGDDFQSIYRFTGCNLNNFLDFPKYFDNAKVLKLTNTYRNSIELISLAGKFIMKNNRQIKKELKSKKSLKNPIEIYFTRNERKCLKKILDNLESGSVFILGRNNKDILPFLDDELILNENKVCYLKREDLNITFLTVHKSKGLEADNVIIINVIDDILGFPSKLEEDKYLHLLTKNEVLFPFDEERRLFYVALTRTKNKCYILSNPKNPSTFVHEIMHDKIPFYIE